jgi:hypothetical protein
MAEIEVEDEFEVDYDCRIDPYNPSDQGIDD